MNHKLIECNSNETNAVGKGEQMFVNNITRNFSLDIVFNIYRRRKTDRTIYRQVSIYYRLVGGDHHLEHKLREGF